MLPSSPKVVGWALGVFALPMQRCLLWRVFLLSAKRTRQASRRGGRATSSQASKGQMVVGARATRYVIYPRAPFERGSDFVGRDARPVCGSNTKIPRSSKQPGQRWRSCMQSTLTRSRSQKPYDWSCRASCQFVTLALLLVSLVTIFFQDGSWAQEAIEGIFNRTCAISYPNFKFSFTIWMLGKAHKYLEEHGALLL